MVKKIVITFLQLIGISLNYVMLHIAFSYPCCQEQGREKSTLIVIGMENFFSFRISVHHDFYCARHFTFLSVTVLMCGIVNFSFITYCDVLFIVSE